MQAPRKSSPQQGDAATRIAALSSALAIIFRGKFCDTILPGRTTTGFDAEEIIYDLGDTSRTLFFIRRGIVKLGTTTDVGRDIIYDLRKAGEVVGELCGVEPVRRDRAVAVERTDAIRVPFAELLDALIKHPALLSEIVEIFCRALAEAYDQVNRVAIDDVRHRLIDVLKALAKKFGRPLGELVEIATYLTQEEIASMILVRRERVSTALNELRRQGVVEYSRKGHLLLDMHALGSPPSAG
jgi:CRP/FNR family cyclic AMP-dependent transcriptional regulator